MESLKGHHIFKSGMLLGTSSNSIDDLDNNDLILSSTKPIKLFNNYLTLTGYTSKELRIYSIILYLISLFGILIHTIVITTLIYQQIKRILLKNRNKIFINRNFTRLFSTSSQSHLINLNTINNASKELSNENKSRNKINHKEHEFQIYNNYVTYAFVFHQSIIDLIRIIYILFFANRLYYEFKKDSIINNSNLIELNQDNLDDYLKNLTQLNPISQAFDSFYETYCSQMASFYSVLTMVTIVNILTILISETCRFYDLKFNSSDTSNYCCVLFGVMLIWTSSLIIISSLMLVGVADSAAPSWNCDLGDSESSTRSLVINIVWFFLLSFVIFIAFSYSISLYKELNRLDHEDNRFCLYTINASLLAVKSDYIERQIKISKLTTKRLFILIMLICLFCVCFLPNFLTSVLKNLFENKNLWKLKPFNLISSIINLSNPCFNSIILLILCLKSNDTYLMNVNTNMIKRRKASVQTFFKRILFPKSSITETDTNRLEQPNESNNLLNNNNVNNDNNLKAKKTNKANKNILINPNDDLNNSCLISCNDECIQLKNLSSLNKTSSLKRDNSNKNVKMLNQNLLNNQTNVKEFYSKIGNRLGNLN